jgi:phosphoserine phosphatase RsbU/P
LAVGGDFYDFLSLDADHLAAVIGDVSGKGVPAALFMAKLISDLRFAGQALREPERILTGLNRDLAGQSRRGMFVTAQYLLLEAESGAVRVADGGHVPPLWYHCRTGEAEILDLAGGPPLGILSEVDYPGTTLRLEHGDSLLLLTDGVLECTNASGEAFGFPRLIQAIRAAGRDGAAFVQPILDAVEAFSREGKRHDDLTLVQVTWC